VALLPVAGAVTLTLGWASAWQRPQAGELTRLQVLAADLRRVRAELMARPPVSPDELTERLPRTLTAGDLLQRIEAAARRSGVRAVSFGTEMAEGQGAAAASVEGSRDEHHPPAERLGCDITLEAEYAALVQFLGLLETSLAVTRVRSLRVVPLPVGVRATVGLEGYAYGGDGLEAAPAQEAR